jgi:hypothetical protein
MKLSLNRSPWSDAKEQNNNGINGGRTRTRTWDPLIKSQLLYQLSYAPGILPAGCAGEVL